LLRGDAVFLQIVAELVVAEAEALGGTALVEAAGGEGLADERRLVAPDACGEIGRLGGGSVRGTLDGGRRLRAERRGEGVEGDVVERATGLAGVLESAVDGAL
jgi:hypothetical protein